MNIYDIPGLNDRLHKDSYYKYIAENFYKFDVVVWVMDVRQGFNTSELIEIKELIINCHTEC
jgi:predicted GTPase